MLKYETIIEYIKDEIAFGNFKHREKLPSVRSLSKQFKCSAGTVIKAYEHLETGHIVYSAPRSGYYLLRNAVKASALFPVVKAGTIRASDAIHDFAVSQGNFLDNDSFQLVSYHIP